MNQTIKARIESIRRGEVPEGYKRTKIGIVPNEWGEERLKHYFKRLTRKNSEKNQNVLTISAQYGLISQEEFFNKSVASEDKSNYFLLNKGHFAYNKSYSNGYPYGAIKRLEYYEKGIVSPLYICLESLQEKTSDYFVQYFEAGLLNKEIHAVAQEGARNHGLLNIAVEDFFNTRVVVPKIPEQEKIAEILEGQDRVIALKKKLLAEKQKQKKYLMQQLLTGKKRLPGFSGEWKTNFLGNICDNLDNFRKPFNRDERATMKGVYPYYGANGIVDYIDRYIFDETIILLAEDGGDFENYFKKPIAQKVIGKCWVNNHAHVLRAKKDYCSEFVFYLLEHKDIRKYINGTTRSKLTKEDMQGILLYYPIDKKEQTAIAEILSAVDKEIELLKKDIEQEKLKKKSLMQLLLMGIVRVL